MKLCYCQINNRSVQQVVSSAGLRVICVVLHTSNVCQVVAVLLQAYNNTLTLQVIRSRRSKATTPALHSEELLYYLAYKKIDFYQAASHRWVTKYCVAIMLHHIREEANSVVSMYRLSYYVTLGSKPVCSEWILTLKEGANIVGVLCHPS